MVKNRIAYVTAWVVLLVFYVYCSSYISLYIIYLFVALSLFSFVCAFAASRKLSVGVKRDCSSADAGKRIAEFCTTVRNGSIVPCPAVFYEAEFRDVSEEGAVRRKFRISLASREEKDIFVTLNAPYAAVMECSVGKLSVCDTLGVFRFKVRSAPQSVTLMITPSSPGEQRTLVKRTAAIPDSDVYSDTVKGDDRSQVFEVREYADGDDIRRVHWRLSSKRDTLIVKEYSKPIEERCTVLLEVSLGAKDDPELKKQRADRLLAQYLVLARQLLQAGRIFSAAVYSSAAGRIMTIDIDTFEDVSSVMRAYLCERLPGEPMISRKAFRAEFPRAKGVYYIYDSAAEDTQLITDDGSWMPIDTKPV